MRILLCPEEFGFGPAAALGYIYRSLEKIKNANLNIDFLGYGHTYDIHKQYAYNKIHHLSVLDENNKNVICSIIKDYDLVISACDFEIAKISFENNVPFIIYDMLSWYWKEIPEICLKAELYIAQNFFFVKERIRNTFVNQKNYNIIPPLVELNGLNEILFSNYHDNKKVIINLGGLYNEFLEKDLYNDFAKQLVSIIDDSLNDAFNEEYEILIFTNSNISFKRERIKFSSTTTPDCVLANMIKADFIFLTPGLGNIYESSLAKVSPYFLFPTNNSQGLQLELLLNNRIECFYSNWNTKEVNYSDNQRDAMKKIGACMQNFLSDNNATYKFKNNVKLYLNYKGLNKMNVLTDLFGYGGISVLNNIIKNSINNFR